MTGADATKISILKKNLEAGPILVTLDARAIGVCVPGNLAQDRALVLRLGYGLVPPVSDLQVGDRELSGTLGFSGVAFHCRIPYHALYRVTGVASDMVWPADIPVDGTEIDPSYRPPSEPVSIKSEPVKVTEPVKRSRSHLSLVP